MTRRSVSGGDHVTTEAGGRRDNLDELVRLETNLTIGGVPTPARPVFVFGQAHRRITNPEEYRRTRERIVHGSREPVVAGFEEAH